MACAGGRIGGTIMSALMVFSLVMAAWFAPGHLFAQEDDSADKAACEDIAGDKAGDVVADGAESGGAVLDGSGSAAADQAISDETGSAAAGETAGDKIGDAVAGETVPGDGPSAVEPVGAAGGASDGSGSGVSDIVLPAGDEADSGLAVASAGDDAAGSGLAVASAPTDALAAGVCGGCSWYITSASAATNPGQLVVYPTDGVAGILANCQSAGDAPWYTNRMAVQSVSVMSGVVTNTGASYLFTGLESCTSMDVANLDVSQCLDLNSVFEGCSSLVSLDLSGWDTSSCVTTVSMFKGCSTLASVLTAGWDTSTCRYMNNMFNGCSNLSTIDVSGWDTSACVNMGSMFLECSNLGSLDVSGWDVSACVHTSMMFSGCSELAMLDVSDWNTSSIQYMNNMFEGCSGLTTLDVSRWDTSACVSSCVMFSGCSQLAVLDVSGWDMSSCTNASIMFSGCSSLTTLNVSDWDTSSCQYLNNLFAGCTGLSSLDVSRWNTSACVFTAAMFQGCSGLSELDLSGWNMPSCTNASIMFAGCSGLTTLNVSGWNTPACQYMNNMFSGCSGITILDLSTFDTSSCVTMGGMFAGCSALCAVSLGGSFSFKGNGTTVLCTLPDAPAVDPYTGNWVRQDGTSSLTATALANDFDGASSAGTYVWEERTQQDGVITISETSGTTAYPNAINFTYTYNGDGVVSVSTSDPNMASVTVDTSTRTVTVTPRAIGNVSITVSAPETQWYTATAATYSLDIVRGELLGEVSIVGDPVVGNSISASSGFPDVVVPEYTWYRSATSDGAGVAVATGADHVVTEEDYGAYLYVVATDASGHFSGGVKSAPVLATAQISAVVPTELHYQVDAAGNMTCMTSAEIDNLSAIHVHVSGILATPVSGVTLATTSDVGTRDDTVGLRITPEDGTLIEVADYVTLAAPPVGNDWSMAARGAQDDHIGLGLQGNIGGFDKLDPAEDTRFLTITWTISAGEAS